LPRAFKILIGVFVLIDFLMVPAYWPAARLAALTALGRSGCSLAATLESYQNLRREVATTEYFKKSSRLVERDSAGLDRWETPRGRFWVPGGDTILPQLLYEQEIRIYGAGERGVRKGDVVLDCGANIGTFTRTALTDGARLVVAIEPAPKTLECLRRNLAPEIAEGRVIIYPKGVWDRDDFLELAVDDHNAGSNSLVIGLERKQSVRVPLTTIDRLVAELKLPRVDLIKMDIEGAEKPALNGARGTLARFKPRLSIAAEHLPDDPERIPQVVRGISSGYKVQPGACQDYVERVRPEVLYFY
jgi:FkbM family methyltransferase